MAAAAANKFATMLHRSSNRIAIVLIYTILEWTLICLLLLNGLFSYLISKFAAFFGLSPPCIFCSRVDHLFEPEKGRPSYRDLLCDGHAGEVSKLGYCSSHRRLALASDMCEDCSSSRPAESDRGAAVLSWMKRIEQGEKDLRCSCCDVILESGFYSPYLLFGPSSWGGLESVGDREKGELIGEAAAAVAVVEEENHLKRPKEDAIFPEEKLEPMELVSCGHAIEGYEMKEEENVKEKSFEEDAIDVVELAEPVASEVGAINQFSDYACRVMDDASLEILTQHLREIYNEERLVPVELIDDSTMRKSPHAFVLCREYDRDLENVGVEQDSRVLDLLSILEDRKEIDSATEMTDIVEEDYSQLREAEQDVGGIAEEEKALDFTADCADVPEVSCSREDGMEQSPMVLVTGSIAEEEKTLVSAPESSDVVEMNSSVEDESKPFDLVVDIGCITEETTALAPLTERADIMEVNSSVNEIEQYAQALDVGTICDEENALASHEEMADIIEEDSSVLPVVVPLLNFSSECHSVVPQTIPMTTMLNGGFVQVEELITNENLPSPQAFQEHNTLIDVEMTRDISIGSEICEQEHIAHAHRDKTISASQNAEAEHLESCNEVTDIDQETEIETVVSAAHSPDHVLVCPALSEIEEERASESPTYIDGIHGLHRRFMFGRRESGTESLDGSVSSEVEGCETLTIDQLKSALKAERRALSSLYAELEEERSASAIAANQTMAMITRLQEEKAAMQMEALQYQRMMEEQSEYDQEALHLVNELLIKRDKEKQQLEKELEVYKKKVLLFQARKRRTAQHKANGVNGTLYASSSAEDSDDLSSEFHEGDEFAYSLDAGNQNTPTDAVLSSEADQETEKHLMTLDDSLDDFDEERLSILEQLKSLEERLVALEDEDLHNFAPIEHFPDENGDMTNGYYEPLRDDVHYARNSFLEDCNANGKLHEQRSKGFKGKRLLPLFDAISDEDGDEKLEKEEQDDASPRAMTNLAKEQEKIAILDEVDIIHERLQAFEADREFLKHCIGSLKKGDKGINLLREILGHLRDLRNVELRARNKSDALASLSV